MRDIDYGHIRVKLNETIKEKNMSKNKLAHIAQMQRTQLNNYCKDNMQRMDMAILSRICYALDCKVSDVLEYIPPDEEE